MNLVFIYSTWAWESVMYFWKRIAQWFANVYPVYEYSIELNRLILHDNNLNSKTSLEFSGGGGGGGRLYKLQITRDEEWGYIWDTWWSI